MNYENFYERRKLGTNNRGRYESVRIVGFDVAEIRREPVTQLRPVIAQRQPRTINLRTRMTLLIYAAIILVGIQLSEGFHFPAAVSLLRRNNIRLGSTSSVLGMATWSNGQAIKEYQDFLASGA